MKREYNNFLENIEEILNKLFLENHCDFNKTYNYLYSFIKKQKNYISNEIFLDINNIINKCMIKIKINMTLNKDNLLEHYLDKFYCFFENSKNCENIFSYLNVLNSKNSITHEKNMINWIKIIYLPNYNKLFNIVNENLNKIKINSKFDSLDVKQNELIVKLLNNKHTNYTHNIEKFFNMLNIISNNTYCKVNKFCEFYYDELHITFTTIKNILTKYDKFYYINQLNLLYLQNESINKSYLYSYFISNNKLKKIFSSIFLSNQFFIECIELFAKYDYKNYLDNIDTLTFNLNNYLKLLDIYDDKTFSTNLININFNNIIKANIEKINIKNDFEELILLSKYLHFISSFYIYDKYLNLINDNIKKCFESCNIFKDKNSEYLVKEINNYIINNIYKKKKKYDNDFQYIMYFTNIEEFSLIYKKYLLKRLIKYNFDSKKINIEMNILNKLCKTENYDSKSIVLCKDFENSLQFTKNYNIIFNKSDNIILGTNNIFPLNHNNYNIDGPFKKDYDKFVTRLTEFHKNVYENRTLKMCDSHTNVSLNFNINNKNYEINATIDICNILFKFNDSNFISKKSIEKSQKNIYEYLVYKKLLIKNKNKEIYEFNDKYYNDKNTINLLDYSKKISKKKIEKKINNEIVFSKTELCNLFIVRHLKKNNIANKNTLYKLVNKKYNIDSVLFNDIIGKLETQDYLTCNNTELIYNL